MKKGLSIAPYDRLLYESLAVRQLSNGDIADGLATLQRGLDLFPEDQVLRDLQDQASRQGISEVMVAKQAQHSAPGAAAKRRKNAARGVSPG